MHIDVSRAYFHAEVQRLVLVRLPADDRIGADAGKVGLLNKSMNRTRERSKQLGAQLARAHQKLGILAGAGVFSWDSARRVCFVMRGTEFQE